jgi:hypothetical protein
LRPVTNRFALGQVGNNLSALDRSMRCLIVPLGTTPDASSPCRGPVQPCIYHKCNQKTFLRVSGENDKNEKRGCAIPVFCCVMRKRFVS